MKNKLLEGWKEVELGEVCILKGGFAFKSQEFVNEGIPIIRISNFNNNEVDLSDAVYYPKKELDIYKEFLLKENDILIAMSGATTGKIGIVTSKSVPSLLNQRVGKFEIKDKLLLNSYLLIFVKSKTFQEEVFRIASGCAQPNISAKQIESIKLSLPPPPIQQKIVSILEKAEQTKKMRKEADELTKDFFKSIFWQMFRSNKDKIAELNLPEVAWFQEGPGVRNYQFTSKGVKLLNVRNIVGGELVLSNTITHISSDEARGKYKHFLVDEGDIIMASSGVTWGKTATAKKEDLPLCMNTSTIRFKILNNKITKDYLLSFLNSPYFTQQISRMITGGCQPNFGPSHLKQVKIPLPPIELQNKFASIVKEVEAMKEQQKHSKEHLDILFNALMQKAFKGELV